MADHLLVKRCSRLDTKAVKTKPVKDYFPRSHTPHGYGALPHSMLIWGADGDGEWYTTRGAAGALGPRSKMTVRAWCVRRLQRTHFGFRDFDEK